jgi:hypothetical protein
LFFRSLAYDVILTVESIGSGDDLLCLLNIRKQIKYPKDKNQAGHCTEAL